MVEGTYTCPKCGGKDSVWRGYRYNESGKKRLRKCKNCGVKFTPDDGFLRRRFQKEHIVEAVSLYQSGLSLAKVKDHMWQHHGVKVSRWMILLWSRDYSKKIDKFTQTLQPEIKGNVHADEVIVKTKGKKYGLEHNNNCAERDNERIKQRYKITRGFKNSESAEDFLRLLDNCYNFERINCIDGRICF